MLQFVHCLKNSTQDRELSLSFLSFCWDLCFSLSPAIIGKDYVKHRVLSDYHCLRALKKLQVPRTMGTELGHCRESLNAKLLGKILPVLRSCSVYTGAWTLLLIFPKRALKTVIIYSVARQFSFAFLYNSAWLTSYFAPTFSFKKSWPTLGKMPEVTRGRHQAEMPPLGSLTSSSHTLFCTGPHKYLHPIRPFPLPHSVLGNLPDRQTITTHSPCTMLPCLSHNAFFPLPTQYSIIPHTTKATSRLVTVFSYYVSHITYFGIGRQSGAIVSIKLLDNKESTYLIDTKKIFQHSFLLIKILGLFLVNSFLAHPRNLP